MQMIRHDLHLGDLYLNFISFLKKQFPEPLFYFSHEHFSAVLGAPDEMIADVVHGCR
jgi:hypothetical protein